MPVEQYLQDVQVSIEGQEHYLGAWAALVHKEFTGKRYGNTEVTPQPTSTPEVACNEFVEYVTQRFFPADGSWINIKDKDESALNALEVLRRRISESNFYSQMAGFLKNGVLFNNALITCDYGGNELHFINYDIFHNDVRVIDTDTIKRGYVQIERNLTALREEYDMEELNVHGVGKISTYLMYFPIIDRYIKGSKANPNDRFFSIEVYNDKILRRKDDIIPTFPTFPIHPFRPTNVRSMGQEALGPAIALKNISLELHWRVKYVNDPSIRLPQEYFNQLRDALKKPPEGT